jgi:hypothetical protein
MRRNRTQAAWPESSYDRAAGDPLERFLPTPGEILGTVRDGTGDAGDRLRIDNPGSAKSRRDGSAEQNWCAAASGVRATAVGQMTTGKRGSLM